VLHDEDLGQAIIDRVLERGRLIRLDGPSVRTLHALKDESDQDDEVARISGSHTCAQELTELLNRLAFRRHPHMPRGVSSCGVQAAAAVEWRRELGDAGLSATS
jgi:hypothetical protein